MSTDGYSPICSRIPIYQLNHDDHDSGHELFTAIDLEPIYQNQLQILEGRLFA
jgi:hypothetical protein